MQSCSSPIEISMHPNFGIQPSDKYEKKERKKEETKQKKKEIEARAQHE